MPTTIWYIILPLHTSVELELANYYSFLSFLLVATKMVVPIVAVALFVYCILWLLCFSMYSVY